MVNIDDIKLPPNDTQVERALLCAIIMDNEILSLTNCKSEWFYGIDNGKIFSAMIQLQRDNNTIDIITIQSISKVDQDYIFSVSIECMSSVWWKTYEDILLEYHTKRRLLNMTNEIQNSMGDVSTDDMFMKMKRLLNSMDEKDNWISWYDLLVSTLEDITTTQNNICDYQYPILDKYLWWYKEWQLIIIWWRPWFGKTALIIELLQRVLLQNKKATIYSLEMSNKEIIKRLISNWSEIQSQLLTKEDNQQTIAERSEPKSDMMKNAMFYDKIFDFNSLERSIRRWSIIQWHNVIFIDHLWLIKSNIKSNNRNQEIWYMTSSLKTLAKELWIAIVLLSQLNRNVEKRNDEPELSDLRDSGSIEQDADVVIMLHRDKESDWHYDNNKLDLLIRKNRNGNLARISMLSDMKYMRIIEAP